MIHRISPYVTQLQSTYPRIDELVVRVAVCITFEKGIDHRLVRNCPLCHRQTLTQDRISRSPGRKGQLCGNSGSNVNDLSKDIGICEKRNGGGGYRLLKSDAVGQVFEQRLQDSDWIDTNDTMGRAVVGDGGTL